MNHYKSYKVKQEEMIPIGDILGKVLIDLKIEEKKRDLSILQAWSKIANDIAGEKLSSKTFAHRITKDRKLVIGIKSAVIANELHFLKDEIEDKLNNLIREQNLKDIQGVVFELRFS
jgi:hypothetical protein